MHKSGIITIGNYLGRCNGDIAFNISFYIIIFSILVAIIRKYINNRKKGLYSYENVSILGFVIFIFTQLIYHVFFFIYDYMYGHFNKSIYSLLASIQENINVILILILPIAFIITILVTISNIKLLKMEGKSWRNMLGMLLGSLICLSTIIVTFLKVTLYSQSRMIFDFFYYSIFLFIAYFECVLIGTCVLGAKAAKKIPKFDKDAIIILGCRVRKDGTLTNLLKSRVDRAIEFSKMQKEITGKDIIFVPSGGKGNDETISEAQAMKNYLIEQGIKEENIIIEDKSTNTVENIKFSNKIIKDNIKSDAKIAFSTSNYHVFRAGIIANNQNIDIEGIGAKTKAYYWVNAFIREFVATLVSERKRHIKVLIILMIIQLFFSVITYTSIM